MPNTFVRRLEHGADLSDDDRAALADLTRNQRRSAPRVSLLAEGEPVTHPFVVLEGWACHWKVLGNGLRQITELILPGDICHPHTGLLSRADHSLSTLSACTTAEVSPRELADLMDRRPAVRRVLRWSTLQVESILREAVLNNGRRQAAERIAHLICEVMTRLDAVGQGAADGVHPWPVTLPELGEITSITPVHVSRSFKVLRNADLIVPRQRFMLVPDFGRLAKFCDFDPAYLHLRSRGPQADQQRF